MRKVVALWITVRPLLSAAPSVLAMRCILDPVIMATIGVLELSRVCIRALLLICMLVPWAVLNVIRDVAARLSLAVVCRKNLALPGSVLG